MPLELLDPDSHGAEGVHGIGDRKRTFEHSRLGSIDHGVGLDEYFNAVGEVVAGHGKNQRANLGRSIRQRNPGLITAFKERLASRARVSWKLV